MRSGTRAVQGAEGPESACGHRCACQRFSSRECGQVAAACCAAATAGVLAPPLEQPVDSGLPTDQVSNQWQEVTCDRLSDAAACACGCKQLSQYHCALIWSKTTFSIPAKPGPWRYFLCEGDPVARNSMHIYLKQGILTLPLQIHRHLSALLAIPYFDTSLAPV